MEVVAERREPGVRVGRHAVRVNDEERRARDERLVVFRRPVLKSGGGEAISDAAFRSLRAISAILERTHSVALTSQLGRAERDEIEEHLTDAECSLGVNRFALAQLRTKSATPQSEAESGTMLDRATGGGHRIEPDRACSDLSE